MERVPMNPRSMELKLPAISSKSSEAVSLHKMDILVPDDSNEDSGSAIFDDSSSSYSPIFSTPRSSSDLSDSRTAYTFSTSSLESSPSKSGIGGQTNKRENATFDTTDSICSSPSIPRYLACQTNSGTSSNSRGTSCSITTTTTTTKNSKMQANSTFDSSRKLLFGKDTTSLEWDDMDNELKPIKQDVIVAAPVENIEESPSIGEWKASPGKTLELSVSRLPSEALPPQGLYEIDLSFKYGNGAWSNVYHGSLKTVDQDGKVVKKLVVAVKRALNKMSVSTLNHEALVLSYIDEKVSMVKHTTILPSIVQFYGFDKPTTSILLSSHPGEQLNDFITRHGQRATVMSSNRTSKLPAVGTRQWIFLAERLIDAMLFLKANGVVHGDVKPHNMLLRKFDHVEPEAWWSPIDDEERKTVLIEPLISDFSSSYILNNDGTIPDDEEAIGAVTTTYCAPELLEAFLTPPVTPNPKASKTSNSPTSKPLYLPNLVQSPARPSSRPVPTFPSDLYSLALTLLQAAIGSHPYSAARMDMQKNMWARQGDPLSFARADERALKCQKGGIVARLIKGCFGKTSAGRTSVEEMNRRVKDMGSEWRLKQRDGIDVWVWKEIF